METIGALNPMAFSVVDPRKYQMTFSEMSRSCSDDFGEFMSILRHVAWEDWHMRSLS